MGKIGLIQVDGGGFPNLALMKLAAYHKSINDDVHFVNVFEEYDKIYMSKIFTFTHDFANYLKCEDVKKGGTGYAINKNFTGYDVLPDSIESLQPDYSIYPSWDKAIAIGFVTRGCIRNCPWCIVPKKEGAVKAVSSLEDILAGRKKAILIDNNILASTFGLNELEWLVKKNEKLKTDFYRIDANQGMDIRLVTPEIAVLLSKVKFIENARRFALDHISVKDKFERNAQLLFDNGVPRSSLVVTVLTKNDELADGVKRLFWLNLVINCKPYLMEYIDFSGKKNKTLKIIEILRQYFNGFVLCKKVSFIDFIKKYHYPYLTFKDMLYLGCDDETAHFLMKSSDEQRIILQKL